MTTHEPTNEPLDENERHLARIVRALPAGEPPAALDALILKAASDAAATSPTRRRLAWIGTTGSFWTIGSAAAAVLAVAVAWHNMNPQTASLATSSPVAVTTDGNEQPGVAVEFKQESPRRFDNSPPPASAPQVARRSVVTVPSPPAPPPAAAPPPAPFPDAGLDEHVADVAADAADAALAGAAAPAPAAAPVAPAAQAARVAAEHRDQEAMAKSAEAESTARARVGSHQAATAQAQAEQRVLPDARRYPESWILKIRTRLKEGDVEGARASLRLYVAKYPQHPVPEDLQPLLRE